MGGKTWKRSIFDIYEDFLTGQIRKGCDVDIPGTEFDVYDLAALAYIYKRIKETEVISEAHHVVIDEAQDFGMMAYAVLDFCIRECTYTIMGDVSQNIHFGYGLNDWEELKELLLSGERDSFGVLKKSYRNTVEISDFATDILHHGQFSSYPVEPIIRHGKKVQVQKTGDRDALIRKAAAVCQSWQENGYDTIAVVCRDRENAAKTAAELDKYITVQESDLEKAVFDKGIMVLPVEYTKGLEFDAVLILDPTLDEYPVEDGHAKLLYVAATRALHELHVLHTGNLTGLIADPLPKRPAPARPMEEKGKEETKKNEKRKIPNTDNGTVSKKRISIVCNPSPDKGVQTHSAAEKAVLPVKKPSAVPAGRQAAAFSVGSRPGVGSSAGVGNSSGVGIPSGVGKPSVSGTGSRRPVIVPAAATTEARPRGNVPAAGNRPVSKEMASAGKGNTAPAFGDLPATEKLRPAGHGKLDLAVRWVTKQPDGLYIQSRYGILRLSPVGSAIVRVTFAKGQQITEGSGRLITVDRTEKAWMYKEVGNGVELTTDELCLRVDKATGSIRYMTRDKKLLLSERSRESRQIETGAGPVDKSWLYLDWPKEEMVYGMGAGVNSGLKLRGCARYISHCGAGELPLLLSDKGYGLLLATENPVFTCDIPVYGTYLYTEKETQQDYYFIGGKKPATILNAYAYLCGKL